MIRRAGKAVITAAVKKMEITLGGLVGSGLKMWWISGSFPYRNGFSWEADDALESVLIERSKAGPL